MSIRLGLLLAISLIALGAPDLADAGRRRQTPDSPLGVVRYDGNGYLTGCTVDPDVSSLAINVHLYVKVPSSTPGAVLFGPPVSDWLLFLTVETAGLSNANLNQHCDVAGDHGYRMIIPPAYRNSQPQTFYVWAIDHNGAAPHTLLAQPGNPTAYAVNVTVGDLHVIGALDKFEEEQAFGWVIDPDDEAAPTSVHLYMDGPAGTGTYIGQVLANQPRPDLNDWGFEGNHGFVFSLPSSVKDGQLREFWTHGIDLSNGPNFLVDPTPKSYAMGEGIEVVGGPELVFDWDQDSCEDFDIPDFPPRAWRDSAENVNLISAMHINRTSVGPDFFNLVHDCTVDLASSYEGPPQAFNNLEWLAATHSPDGNTVYGLVHNEFHGLLPGQAATMLPTLYDLALCPSQETPDPVTGQPRFCWYNSITAVVRNGLGQPFVDPPPGVSRLVATLPYQYVPTDTHARGYMGASSIHHNVYSLPAGSPPPPASNQYQDGDGLYYVLISAQKHPNTASPIQRQGACLLRTNDLSDPSSWRAWDGSDGFIRSFTNPYPVAPSNPWNFVCEPVYFGVTGLAPPVDQGLVWSTHLQRFLTVTATVQGNPNVWAAYYSTSDNLTEWDDASLIVDLKLCFEAGDTEPCYSYAALIDHEDDTRNFEKAGQTAYLYMTRHNRELGFPLNYLDRDLLRFPVRFRDP